MPTYLIKTIISACLAGMVVLMSGCARSSAEWTHLTGETMGTHYQVRFLHIDKSDPKAVKTQTSMLLRSIQAELSTWETTSWISQFNQAPADKPMPVPSHAWAVLNASLDVAAASQGTFSPTAYPLIQAWGFGPKQRESSEAPDTDTIHQLQTLADYRVITLDATAQTVAKISDAVQIDLSASTKGYTVDQVASILEQRGITRYLIDIGGEVRVSGTSAKDRPWHVGVQIPNGFTGEQPILRLDGHAVATSGGSKIFKTINDTVRTHIIDLRSGTPLTGAHPVYSVSVIAEDCMFADALATAAFILGPQESQSLVDAYPQSALIFLLHDETIVPMGNPLLLSTADHLNQ